MRARDIKIGNWYRVGRWYRVTTSSAVVWYTYFCVALKVARETGRHARITWLKPDFGIFYTLPYNAVEPLKESQIISVEMGLSDHERKLIADAKGGKEICRLR